MADVPERMDYGEKLFAHNYRQAGETELVLKPIGVIVKTKKISITVFLLLAGICFNREVFAETLYQDDFSAGASGWKAHDSASESGIVEEIKKWFQKQK